MKIIFIHFRLNVTSLKIFKSKVFVVVIIIF